MRSRFNDNLAAFAKICPFLEAEGFTNQAEKSLQELRFSASRSYHTGPIQALN
jgi:hypothetical protein